MPKMRVLECTEPGCGHTWTFLAMKPTDRNPACPICAARSEQGLAAPAIGMGARPSTTMAVPQDRTKALDMAQRIIAEDNKMGDLNVGSKSRPGEPIAKLVPVQPGMEPQWGAGGASRKLPLDFGGAAAVGAAERQVAGAVVHERANLLDRLANKRQQSMKPVYREPKQ